MHSLVGLHVRIHPAQSISVQLLPSFESGCASPDCTPQYPINMSSSTAPRLRALYRSFLRELPPRPILSKTPSPLHQRLREHFRPENTPEQAVAQAEQYLAYIRAQRTYVTLLERYNPGMGMDEEERVRLTARRVGMNLPIEFEKEK